MNLEAVDQCWQLSNYNTLAFDARLIALLYAIAMLIGTYRLYIDYAVIEDWQLFREQFRIKAIA